MNDINNNIVNKTNATPSCFPTPRNNKFEATYIVPINWKAILRKFYQDMPLKRHQRQLRQFEDSFTGKDAIDFMHVVIPKVVYNKTCDRKMALNLLNCFLKFHYLVNIRNEEDLEFHDNVTIYKFCDDKIRAFLEDSPVSSIPDRKSRDIRRISSLKASSLESYHKATQKSASSTPLSVARIKTCERVPQSVLINSFKQEKGSKVQTSIWAVQSKPCAVVCVPDTLPEKKSKLSDISTPQTNNVNTVEGTGFSKRRRILSGFRSFRTTSSSSYSSPRSPKQKAADCKSNKIPNLSAIRSFRSTNASQSSPTSPKQTVDANKVFCSRIDKHVYDEQSRTLDQFLLKLLDQIVSDEILTSTEKLEKLKKFRVAHSNVYQMRFKDPESDPIHNLKNDISTPNSSSTVNALMRRIQHLLPYA